MKVNSLCGAFSGALPLPLQQIYIFERWLNRRGRIDHEHAIGNLTAGKAVCTAAGLFLTGGARSWCERWSQPCRPTRPLRAMPCRHSHGSRAASSLNQSKGQMHSSVEKPSILLRNRGRKPTRLIQSISESRLRMQTESSRSGLCMIDSPLSTAIHPSRRSDTLKRYWN